MNARLKINMVEVTRLTRDGRLDEAMALLRGAVPSAPSSNSGGNTQPGSKGPTIEMVPPSLSTGESWTSPEWGDADRPANSGSALGAGKRWPQLGLGRGLEGLARPGESRTHRSARWRTVWRAHLCQSGGKSRLQALCSERLQRTAVAPCGDAARLHPVARRLCCRHADERFG